MNIRIILRFLATSPLAATAPAVHAQADCDNWAWSELFENAAVAPER